MPKNYTCRGRVEMVNTRRLVLVALLSAMSYGLMFTLQIPLIPAAPYLKFDPSDVPTLTGAFLLGPWAGVQIALIKVALFFMTKGAGGPIGATMNFVSTAVLALVAGYIYRRRPGPVAALAGMIAGGLIMTLVMIPVNYYWALGAYGIPQPLHADLIRTALVPFNLARGALSTAITLPLFLALSRALKRRNFKVV